jgi:hypothetical protein
MLMLTSMGGSSGWHYTISYNDADRSQLPSYSAGPAGRTFPSAAGFHTSDLFFTDDNGHTTSPRMTSTLLQRITEVRENN